MESWKQELHVLLETVIGSPYGTTPFWVATGIALTCLLILGWLITNFIFQAKRGFLLSFIANLIPAAAAAAAWIAVSLHAVPELSAGPIRDYLPLGAAVLGAFLGTMLLSKFILGISEGATVLAVIFTYICVGAAIYFAGTLAAEVDSSLDSIEQKSDEKKSEAEWLLNH